MPSEVEVPPAKAVPNKLVTFAAADFALANNDRKSFYESIQQVLWNIAAEVCEVPPSGLNKHNVAALLKQKSIPSDTIAEFNMVLNECEWALYTPDPTATDMIAMKQKAERLFEELQSPNL